jgi:4-hydroxybenzoate polyprenyltransferase
MMASTDAILPRRVQAGRPRWRAYLLLARVSNLPTVWSNVLAGFVAVSSAADWPSFIRVAGAVSLFYAGGMFLNDAFDAVFDQKTRPERPIPSGDTSRSEAFLAGALLIGAGELFLAPNPVTLLLGLGLAASIVFYDVRHKGVPAAPLVMGLCRALVYCIAAAAAGFVSGTALAGAAVVGAYVVGLTLVAKASGPQARWLVPLLLAGISLVDAGFIAVVSGSAVLTAGAVSCFALTLCLQRFVPGD